ncbi:MAG: hypothetical protein OEW22_00895, partial [Rubrivivax sp.]|nr:hypothetical protein [Rubrivivax sp.]
MNPSWRFLAVLGGLSGLAACAPRVEAWSPAGETLAWLLVAAGAGGVGWLLAGARQRNALHTARQQARLCAELTPGLAFEIDAQLRLTAGPLGAEGRWLWDVFDAGPDQDRLRQTLRQQAGVEPLVVAKAGEGTLWQLRAVPRFDPAGAFAGHQGLALPLDVDLPAAAALRALVDGSAGATLVAVGGPASAGWRVLRANAAAQACFGSDKQLSDAQLRAGLPPALHHAFDAREATAEAQGWQLR